jgi:hypothetical protein
LITFFGNYLIKNFKLIVIILFLAVCGGANSQVKTAVGFWKWTSWALLQGVPSVTYFEDRNSADSRLKFGLEWQVVPASYSFNTNKYLSDFNFFFINPVKRFSGSLELFFQPELIPGAFKYADLNKFMFKTGARIVLPLWQKGEYLSFSLGSGYSYQKTTSGEVKGGATYEAAVYSFFGMLGLKFNYNQNAPSRYNFGMYFKYY